MEIRLARAVLQLFREEKPAHFPAFSVREWERSYYWLDASGMALYLLAELRSHGLEDQLPNEVRWRLERNSTDNRARTQHVFEEFARVNKSLTELGLRYANLKGFTLIGSAVTEPSLRYQSDLDILIPHCDAFRVSEALKPFGYLLDHASDLVWEFKAGAGILPTLEDRYKPGPQRSIEVHLLPAGAVDGPHGDLLDRVQMQQRNGCIFPALCDPDKFISLAQHLFRQMRYEWTRLSWVLEFRHFMVARREDAQFWRSVRTAAAASPDMTTALGASMLMATVVLGDCVPAGVSEWTSDRLSAPVRIWIERYSEAVLLTDFPGTKLYLLLETALAADAQAVKSLRWRRLIPLRLPSSVVQRQSAGSTMRLRAGRAATQLRYNGFRLRFHLVQGMRYLLEAKRWKRIAALPQS